MLTHQHLFSRSLSPFLSYARIDSNVHTQQPSMMMMMSTFHVVRKFFFFVFKRPTRERVAKRCTYNANLTNLNNKKKKKN